MKRVFIVFIALLSIVACKQQQKSKYRNAGEYNDHIVHYQTNIMKKLMAFVDATAINIDSSEEMLDKDIIYLDTVIKDVKNMGAFKGDSTLRDAAVNSFSFYQSIFANEYKQLMNIRRQSNTGSDETSTETNKIIAGITEKEKQLDLEFQSAQKSFARKNNMMLTPNGMDKEIHKPVNQP
jgi:hypothetical protein